MNAFYHQQITREALDIKVSQTALTTIISANLELDNLSGQLGHPEFHFDNNSFLASQRFMDEQSLRAISFIQASDPFSALEAFGRLTHTCQDFYAHSNYVALWANSHPRLKPVEINPIDPEILASPSLQSGRIYYPGELFTYLPVIGKIFKYLLPRNAHAWMNLDSPASGDLFEFARFAALKRTKVEFERLSSRLLGSGGIRFISIFSGKSEI